MAEEQLNYGDYLESYFDAQVDNFAENGLTTAGQLEKLEQPEIEESIKQADIVCISIGGNDLLRIIEKAIIEYNAGNNNVFENGNNLNLSEEFVESFVINYSSALGSASVEAGTNIEEIKNKIYEINPDVNLIMQTIYVPFESSEENLNKILRPLKTFSSIFVGTINSAIRNNADTIADINLKFRKKPYIYTNIDSFDIHPNYLGHMLIAEEIIQTLKLSGNEAVFKEMSDNIPHGVFSEMPDYISYELDEFSNGKIRDCTLEEAINNFVSASENTSEETEAEETSEQLQTETNSDGDKKDSSDKAILSRIFLIIGLALILFVTAFNYIKKRRKH